MSLQPTSIYIFSILVSILEFISFILSQFYIVIHSISKLGNLTDIWSVELRNNIPLWKYYYNIQYARHEVGAQKNYRVKRCCHFFIANDSTFYQNQNQVTRFLTVGPHSLNLKFTSLRTCLKIVFTLLNTKSVVVF